MPDGFSTFEQEKRVKSLKRRLESWREFLVTFYPVIIWTEPWYPAVIVGVISTLFLIYWYWSPPILTTLSLTFMLVNLIGFSVPKICTVIRPPQQWTAIKEKKYELICESVVKTQEMISSQTDRLKNYKETNSVMYFMVLIPCCSFLAWIGYSVNNWIIGYIFVMVVTLYPGLMHNQVLEKVASFFFCRVTDGIRYFKRKDDVKKE